jgi:hypothetical protein
MCAGIHEAQQHPREGPAAAAAAVCHRLPLSLALASVLQVPVSRSPSPPACSIAHSLYGMLALLPQGPTTPPHHPPAQHVPPLPRLTSLSCWVLLAAPDSATTTCSCASCSLVAAWMSCRLGRLLSRGWEAVEASATEARRELASSLLRVCSLPPPAAAAAAVKEGAEGSSSSCWVAGGSAVGAVALVATAVGGCSLLAGAWAPGCRCAAAHTCLLLPGRTNRPCRSWAGTRHTLHTADRCCCTAAAWHGVLLAVVETGLAFSMQDPGRYHTFPALQLNGHFALSSASSLAPSSTAVGTAAACTAGGCVGQLEDRVSRPPKSHLQ